jgi:hypothetical protein
VPVPLTVIGKPKVLPFVVINSVPAPLKVVAFAPEVKVPPDAGIVKLPYIVRSVLLKLPVKPVKSKLLKGPVNATVSDEAPITTPLVPEVETLKPAAVASDIAPIEKVLVPTAPVYVLLMYTVPDIVRLVIVVISKIVALFPVNNN